MIILFILGLLLGAVAVIFSLQNITVVTVSFFEWQVDGSLAVILILAILTGILVCLLILLPGTIQTALRLRALTKENKKLEEDLKRQKVKTVFAKNESPTPEEIEAIEHGAINY